MSRRWRLLCATALAAVASNAQQAAEEPLVINLEGLSAPLADALRDARATAERDAAAAPNDAARAAAWGNLGMFYQAQHLPWAAEQAYDRALAAADDARWRYLRAVVLEERGETEKAIADYQHVTEQSPNNTAAWYRLGAGRLLEGDHAGAEAALDAALRLAPDYAVALAAKADVAAARQDWKQAVGLLEKAWALAPGAGQLAYKLALANRALGNLEAARGWLQRRGDANAAPKMDDPLLLEVAQLSLSARFFVKAGEWALERGDLPAAVEALRNAVALAPDAADIRLTYARLLEQDGKPAAAEREVRRLLDADAQSAKAWYQLAWLLRHAQPPEEAQAAAERSLTLADATPARVLAAAFAMRAGRFAAAATHYAKAKAADPGNAYFHYWHGLAQAAQGDCAGREALARALALRPNWGEAHIALARVDAVCGRAAAALRRARGLLRVKDDVDTRLTLAFAELAAGDSETAARRIAEAGSHPDATLLDTASAKGEMPSRPFAAGSRWWLPSELRRAPRKAP